MQYPLSLSFKVWAFSPQITVRDADGNLVGYVKQKLFKLKEDVVVFADEAQTKPLYNIKADRILDVSACYHFTDLAGGKLGAIKRRGWRSMWRAHYEILDGENPVMNVREESVLTRFLDGAFQEIPILGIFSGYVFNPSYLVSRLDGAPVMRLKKQPAFLEGRFAISKLGELTLQEEQRILLGLIMMTLLERMRG